jgi:plastocyanin
MSNRVEISKRSWSAGTRVAVASFVVASVVFAMFAFAPSSQAIPSETEILPDGQQRTTFFVGPFDVTSGQNRISNRPIVGSGRPSVDGWITRIEPNLVEADGTVPLSSRVMFHHGVWLNQSRPDPTFPGYPQRFYATGEEKTTMELPDGFGYRYLKSDVWILNHMIHNLVPDPMELYITYTVDFIPDGSPLAEGIKPVRPIWMDVENGSGYPVFDVLRDSGGRDGEFTYPQDADDPYGNWKKNEWTVDRDGVLLQTIGHVHTGGLSTELYLNREGARYEGPRCRGFKPLTARQKRNWSKQRKRSYVRKEKTRVRKCRNTQPNVVGDRVEIFRSGAFYFGNRPPISWDVAMIGTKPNWRVEVKAGDVLELQTTYETKIASWYESMGINVVYMADAEDADGPNPYEKRVDYPGVLNHGRLAENRDHGGDKMVAPNPAKLPSGLLSSGPISIGGYSYGAGNFRLPGTAGRPPVVEQGDTFTFQMAPNDVANEIWHSVTSCKSPCNRSTGISYPIADGDFQFDSGQMGTGGAPTVNRTTWSTPSYLPVGTHTFFCRIHPLMRGAIRVVPPKR